MPYGPFNLTNDAFATVRALDLTNVAALIGNDFGSFIACCCALMRPNIQPGPSRGAHQHR